MKKYRCLIYIDNDPFQFNVEGNLIGKMQNILYKSKNNVIENTSWENIGFKVIKNFLTIDQFDKLKDSTEKTLIKIIEKLGIKIDKKAFTLENYHLFIKSEKEHQEIIKNTSNLTISDFEFDIEIITKYLSQLLNVKLTSKIQKLNRSHIQVRINRPNSFDINPPHRDGYIDIYKDVLNVWLPIVGCNKETSLPVVIGSHLIPEDQVFKTSNKGAKINDNFYNVPCILKTSDGPLDMIRPNPLKTEALIFTPFLIHGAAFNNSSFTRVAFELRFPKLSG